MFSTLIGDSRPADDGFFGTIVGGWVEGLSKVGSDILPNWVGSQVIEQSDDQLNDSTYNSTTAPQKLDAGAAVQTGDEPKTGIQKALWDLSVGKITTGPLVVAGLVLIGLVIVFKKF